MTKKEKDQMVMLMTRCQKAEKKAAILDQIGAAVMELIHDEVEQIAREAADEVVDDLQISR